MMRGWRRRTRSGQLAGPLLLALALLAVPQAEARGGAGLASPRPPAPLSQVADDPAICAAVEDAARTIAADDQARGLRLDRAERDLAPQGRYGAPQLCVLYHPAEDALQAVIAPIDASRISASMTSTR